MKKIIIIFLFSAYYLLFASAPIIIPMTDQATYDYIDYLNISGMINIPFTGTKPYRSDKIYKMLLEIKEPDSRTRNFIKRFEEEYLDKENRFGKTESKNLVAWFDPYINQSYITQEASDKPLYKKLSLYHYLSKNYGQARLNYDYPDISQHITDGGLNAYIGYKDFLSLRTSSGVMIKHSYDKHMRDEYEPLVLCTSGERDEFSSEDYTETSMLISGEGISFSIGKYPLSMGSGMINSLTLSALDAYYENFMFSISGERIKFSTVTGFLLADTQTRFEEPYYATINETDQVKYFKREKYLSAHRLEWRALDNLNLGINEMVISGDRSIELGYMVPILPLFWMGHYYGDKDNSLISFDLSYKPFKDLSVFSELLFDDESFSESWTEYYGNKWAVSGGLYNTDFLTIDGLSFNIEYARVEPYVYGHYFHINRYMNMDYFLGLPGGPDSETLNSKLSYLLDFDKSITVGFSRENRGEPIWGSWDEPAYAKDKKIFLRGTVEKKNNIYAELNYRPNKYISADFFYSFTNIENYNHNLPSYNSIQNDFINLGFEDWLDKYNYGFDTDIDEDGNMGEEEDNDGDEISAEDEHFQYINYNDFYNREIVPKKTSQEYTNNTFRLTLNFILKNYFSGFFKREEK
ncbi:MAG: capsule assembly Wzi family protein [Candidatus Delongbacteria bacterium]|nr:capsule assembly Wzi family protein [Candidatus Delongbacteria bacterium]